MIGEGAEENVVLIWQSKALRFDTAKIRALSLLFENKALEDRWDSSHKSRLQAMTVRYLFASGLFQGMFLWSDVLRVTMTRS